MAQYPRSSCTFLDGLLDKWPDSSFKTVTEMVLILTFALLFGCASIVAIGKHRPRFIAGASRLGQNHCRLDAMR